MMWEVDVVVDVVLFNVELLLAAVSFSQKYGCQDLFEEMIVG